MMTSSAKQQIIDTANDIIQGRESILEGALKLSSKRYQIHELSEHEVFDLFRAIDSETDHWPIREAREYWSEEALKRVDKEIEDYENDIRLDVIQKCKELIKILETH